MKLQGRGPARYVIKTMQLLVFCNSTLVIMNF